MSPVERILARIHHTVDADEGRTLSRVMEVLTELVQDRNCTDIRVSPTPLKEIEEMLPVIRTGELDVYIHNEERIGVKAIRALAQEASGTPVLWISHDGPTSVARKEASCMDVQFMPLKSVCYNITRHVLVPRHVVVPGVEPDASLPKLLDTDPVVCYFGWPVGTTVRITRNWGGSEPTTYLRVVCCSSDGG